MNRRKIVSVFAAVLAIFFLASTLQAAPKKEKDKSAQKDAKEPEFKVEKRKSSQFGVTPINQRAVGSAGQLISLKMRIENLSSGPARYSAKPAALTATTGGLVQKPIMTVPPSHLSRHVTFEPEQPFVLPPKSQKEFNIIIDIPPDVSGTQYVGIEIANSTDPDFDQSRKGEYQASMGVGMQPGLLSVIRVDISGTLKYSYKVNKLDVARSEWNRPPVATLSFFNNGNAELSIVPFLIIVDPSSKKVMARFKTSSTVTIRPSEEKAIEFDPATASIPPGRYNAILSFANKDPALPPFEQAVSIK